MYNVRGSVINKKQVCEVYGKHKKQVTMWFAPAFINSAAFTSVLVLHEEVFALLGKLEARTHLVISTAAAWIQEEKAHTSGK